MACFTNHTASAFGSSCCNGNTLCSWNGNMDDVVSVPVYVQSIYDAVQFNLQGMKTIQNQKFSPAVPCGYTVSRVADIRTKAFFNPCSVDDSRNLTAEMDTTLTGAAFVQDCHGKPVTVTGPDGTYSQKIIYPENDCCDENGRGASVFGTQNVMIHGNILVYIDLVLCNNCNHECTFTVCAEIPVATESRPMCLTNFFEICIPAGTNHAFLPRFTELNSISCEARLATNNCGRDLTIDHDGELSGNLIISICVNAEKTVVAPIQMCVLSTGIIDPPAQTNTGCSGFPSMFAGEITASGNNDCGCGNNWDDRMMFDNRRDCRNDTGCGCDTHYEHSKDCGCSTHYEPADECGCTPVHDRSNDCGCKR